MSRQTMSNSGMVTTCDGRCIRGRIAGSPRSPSRSVEAHEATGTSSAVRRTPALVAGGVVLLVVGALALWWRTAEGTANASTPGTASSEAGFSRDMSVHHRQAVEMPLIVRARTGDQEVRTLAYDIIDTQATQRGMMLGRLEGRGLNKTSSQAPMTGRGHGSMHEAKDGSLLPGMATTTQLDQLRLSFSLSEQRIGPLDAKLADRSAYRGTDTLTLPIAGTRTMKATVRVSDIDRVTVSKTVEIR